ncbi:MAG: mechanosensitive ion channel family protein [Candidatus Thermoplasmatota archaeon]|nr:mechanosensitive ion channel family protein [Candidatus Thermoplasmatota archaeon]
MRSLVWTVAIFLIVNEFGIELSGIFASFAVFSLIAGLALQQSLGNILNSFMLAMDRPFDVGDRIEVNGIEGKVVSSGILSTKLLTWSEELVIIPNNSLVSNTVVNQARGGGDGIPKRLNLLVDIGVDYSEDPPHIKKILIEVAKSCPYTLEDPSPRALLIRLGEYSRDFRLYTWISDYSDEWPARDWILQAISDRFNEEDIIIPFPVSIEMKAQPSYKGANRELRVRRKEARQHAARLQMARADQVHREERDTVRSEIAWLEQQLLDTSLQSREKEKIRAEIAALASTLDMFDGD